MEARIVVMLVTGLAFSICYMFDKYVNQLRLESNTMRIQRSLAYPN